MNVVSVFSVISETGVYLGCQAAPEAAQRENSYPGKTAKRAHIRERHNGQAAVLVLLAKSGLPDRMQAVSALFVDRARNQTDSITASAGRPVPTKERIAMRTHQS
jgi:hypothetical protein